MKGDTRTHKQTYTHIRKSSRAHTCMSKFVTHICMATLIVLEIIFVIYLWPVTIYTHPRTDPQRTAHVRAHTQTEAHTCKRTDAMYITHTHRRQCYWNRVYGWAKSIEFGAFRHRQEGTAGIIRSCPVLMGTPSCKFNTCLRARTHASRKVWRERQIKH